MKGFAELKEYMATLPVICTHSHHYVDEKQVNVTLADLLQSSYIRWCKIPLTPTKENIAHFTRMLRHNSYFHWMEKSLQEICGISKPLNEETYDLFDAKVRELYRDPAHHDRVLREKCGYKKVILDCYWQPGSDNGHPDLNTPTYRIDMFAFGYNATARDHDGNNPFRFYGLTPGISFAEYLAFYEKKIREAVAGGCICLKNALAYDRTNDYKKVSYEAAEKAFFNEEADAADIKNFQDYLFWFACDLAGELDVPVQIHTGLGKLEGSNAKYLRDVIDAHPNVRFDIFHAGYPWMEDVCGLVHNYPNVYADLCWLPIISTTAAVRFIKEILEVGNLGSMMWGSDTWRSEESYGAVLAAREAIARALCEMMEDGYLTMEDAKEICRAILYENAERVFHISAK